MVGMHYVRVPRATVRTYEDRSLTAWCWQGTGQETRRPGTVVKSSPLSYAAPSPAVIVVAACVQGSRPVCPTCPFGAVQENLRQLCVFKLANETGQPWHWWDYVTKFGDECSMDDRTYDEACAERVRRFYGGFDRSTLWVAGFQFH